MEKHGAINSETPCSRPGCCKSAGEKQAQLEFVFPEDIKTADKIEDSVMKDASDAVKQATKK